MKTELLLRTPTETISLHNLLEDLPQNSSHCDFGADINLANQVLLSQEFDVNQKVKCLFDWLSRNQPCLFGRLAALESKGLSVSICWIDEDEILLGDLYLSRKIQSARRSWKDRAERGESHGLLVFFNSYKLTYARPSIELLNVCQHISDLYFVEHAPIETDAIYTEAIPLRNADGKLSVFKAGANIFYTGSHITQNHDRRIPGGLMISINAVGHYINSLVLRGLSSSLSDAVDYALSIAWGSIGNGGIGNARMESLTWHNQVTCPIKLNIDDSNMDIHSKKYSGLYHTDVLLPKSVTIDANQIDKLDGNYSDCEVWKELELDYLTTQSFDKEDSNYGFIQGHPIPDEAKYHNPWTPVRVYNRSGLVYG